MRKPFNNNYDCDPGRIRHKISFWKVQQVSDGFGGTTETEVKVIETKAAKENVNRYDQMAFEAGANVFNEATYFIIRNRKDFYPTKDLILKHDGNDYQILGVVPKGDPCTFLQLLCALSK